MKIKYLAAVPLITLSSALFSCNGYKNNADKDNTELRRMSYLDIVAADAVKNIDNAQTMYNNAVEIQSLADSTRAKTTMAQYKTQYNEAKARELDAQQRLASTKNENGHAYKRAFNHYQLVAQECAPVIETYERAQRELDISRGVDVKEAEKDLNEEKSRLSKIIEYINLSKKPVEKRTSKENEKLDSIYNFCENTENIGLVADISKKLVDYMENGGK